jgi:hypothetical protein
VFRNRRRRRFDPVYYRLLNARQLLSSIILQCIYRNMKLEQRPSAELALQGVFDRSEEPSRLSLHSHVAVERLDSSVFERVKLVTDREDCLDRMGMSLLLRPAESARVPFSRSSRWRTIASLARPSSKLIGISFS